MANGLLTVQEFRERALDTLGRAQANKITEPDFGARDMRDAMLHIREAQMRAMQAMQAQIRFEAAPWPFDPPQRLPSGPPPAPPVAHAIAAPVGEIDPELLAHEALAKKLGITCVAPEIAEQRLRQVLAEEHITCYDRKAVEEYLNVMAERAQAEMKPGEWGRMTWGWFAARKVDLAAVIENDARARDSVYAQPIPLPVLMTMERIVDRLGDQVRFLVGAITKGDPFLAVVARGSDELFVIERWLEPGFRGVKG